MTALLERPLPDATEGDTPPPVEIHQMHISDPKRVWSATWTTDDPRALTFAEETFTSRKAQGYLAYRTTAPDQHELIREFDASAPTIVLTRPLYGG